MTYCSTIRLSLLLLGMGISDAKAYDAQQIQNALSGSMPVFAAEALKCIPDAGRKLLAARSYLRSHADLEKRWSWSDAQIAAYEGSSEQKVLLSDIARINAHFSKANSGYSLFINTRVRSLDKQIASWNENASVGSAAENMLTALKADPSMSLNETDSKSAQKLNAWLASHAPKPSPNLAAPGLSAHGQMRAIDFQISKNGTLIAPADSNKTESIWRSQGWDLKLKASITEAGPAFVGPLTSPDEPWHYSYSPTHEKTEHDKISP